MPAAVNVQLRTSIPDYTAGLHPKGTQWTLTTAEEIATVAKGFVAKDTHSLEESIGFEPFGAEAARAGGGGAWAGAVVFAGDMSGGYKGSDKKRAGAPIDYAEPQEFGTGTHAACPFMTPAAEQVWPTAIERMSAMLAVI